MNLLLIPLLLLPLVGATAPPQQIFSNPSQDESKFQIPTSYESAILARRILHLTPIGELSTVFPVSSSSDGYEAFGTKPSNLGGIPIGLMDYYADCEGSGNPTILAIDIATAFVNVAHGSNITLSLRWVPPYPPKPRRSSWSLPFFQSSKRSENEPPVLPYSAANLPRFSLLGYLEKISPEDVEAEQLAKCFTTVHPDARIWLPGNRIHVSYWTRLVVTQVYWIGGFGDRNYIGWIPVEEWRNVTEKEWQSIRLPGERKGWKGWNIEEL